MTRAALMMALAGACANPLPPDHDVACVEELVAPTPIDPGGTLTHWRIDSATLPDSATTSTQLGLDLDCDPYGRPDNHIGRLISLVYEVDENVDLDGELQAMIDAGELTHLLSLRSTGLVASEGVALTVRHGSGSEPFEIDQQRGSGTLTGTLVDGNLRLHGGPLPIGLTLPGAGEVVILPLAGVRLDADIVDGRIEGRIGGAISMAAWDLSLLPFVHRALSRAIERDCPDMVAGEVPCACVPGSFGAGLIDYLDEQPDRTGTQPDGDCVFPLEELRDSSLLSSLFTADLDLFDDGELAPRIDGDKDAMSIGIGFTAVPAQLAP